MHSVSFNYPEHPTEQQRKDYIDFFRVIGKVVPCPSCGTHYDEYLDKKDPAAQEFRQAGGLLLERFIPVPLASAGLRERMRW